MKENLRRASKESITIIKPRENKRGNDTVRTLTSITEVYVKKHCGNIDKYNRSVCEKTLWEH